MMGILLVAPRRTHDIVYYTIKTPFGNGSVTLRIVSQGDKNNW